MANEYRFGIEEEFFLASARSRGAPQRSIAAFHKDAQKRLHVAEREVLQSQIEISTEPSASFEEVRAKLSDLRCGLADVGRKHNLLVFAAGTHPTALWPAQRKTEKARYQRIIDELQMVGRRWVVCGQHVHVEVPRPEARVDMMNRLLPFLPVLLALSTSSPFWEKRRTGLAGYRLRAYAELPRAGLPDVFDDEADYARFIQVMTESGAIEDATFLWWHIRPSIRYPTLELRVADACTRLDDTLAVAALYRCLVRLVDRRPDIHAKLTGASRGFVTENLWRAQRDGVRASLIDETQARTVPVPAMVDALLNLIAEDAAALGCAAEVAHAKVIALNGSSADGQIAAYDAALERGADDDEALRDVVDWLARETTGAPA
ncbi:carboxylate-amine ligase [Methylobacterium sp. J-070]|uniref:carboxylate-amine ligase n=1 Tax=Methylobacterium sp. J-070 TaxID=2836650 RepID=UPI001FBAC82C|nr:carboxylate-amine ligase [Methylobacterium sp. J-070]MCJ2052320.1 carboxylate-amine ligase [Methylobacterium sp. J-070]